MTPFSWLSRFRRQRSLPHGRRQSMPVRGSQLHLEALEDRLLLSATPVSANIISGYVYNDANNNGLKDAAEHGIANAPVNLYDATGALVASTVTDPNGFYQFATDPRISTAPQTQTVTASFTSKSTDWTQQQAIAQFNPALGTLVSIDIQNNDPITSDIKVENLDTATQTVNAVVQGTLSLSGPSFSPLTTDLSATQSFNASAFDGTIDFGGTSGHDFGPQTANGSKSITLTDPTAMAAYIGTGMVTFSETAQGTSTVDGSANVISQINTVASSDVTVIYHYIPNNGLKPGNYTVTQPSDPQGYLDGEVTAGNVTPIPHSVGSNSIPVTLVNGTPSSNNNFAEVRPSTLAGYVYLDANDNGAKDSNESGIANVTVLLQGTDDTGAAVSLSTTTAADGSYSFGNLRPGNYSVVETPPTGYLARTITAGNDGGTVGNALVNGITISPGSQGVNYNFGHVQPGSLAGYVYFDANDNGVRDTSELGIANVAVHLTGTDDLGNAVNLTATTAADGSYGFTNLRPGTYTIQEMPPVQYLQGKDAVGSLGGNGSTVNRFTAINVGSAAAGTEYDFGHLLPGSLSGYVYVDKNKSGMRQTGDPGIRGVRIILTGTDDLGNAVRQVQLTLADGSYSFSNLRPGTYTIQEVQPAHYLPAMDTIGTNGGTVGAGVFSNIQLPVGFQGTDNDFGHLVPPPPPPIVPPFVPPPVPPTPGWSKQSLIFFFG